MRKREKEGRREGERYIERERSENGDRGRRGTVVVRRKTHGRGKKRGVKKTGEEGEERRRG